MFYIVCHKLLKQTSHIKKIPLVALIRPRSGRLRYHKGFFTNNQVYHTNHSFRMKEIILLFSVLTNINCCTHPICIQQCAASHDNPTMYHVRTIESCAIACRERQWLRGLGRLIYPVRWKSVKIILKFWYWKHSSCWFPGINFWLTKSCWCIQGTCHEYEYLFCRKALWMYCI